MTASAKLLAPLAMAFALALPAGAQDASGIAALDAARADGTSFQEQFLKAKGPVILVNIFEVQPGDAERFKAEWQRAAAVMRRMPGFVASTFHRGVGESRYWMNYAEWESAEALGRALGSPEFQAAAAAIRVPSFRRLYAAEEKMAP